MVLGGKFDYNHSMVMIDENSQLPPAGVVKEDGPLPSVVSKTVVEFGRRYYLIDTILHSTKNYLPAKN